MYDLTRLTETMIVKNKILQATRGNMMATFIMVMFQNITSPMHKPS